MRVAVHDCFPNHETAEMELVQRFVRAFQNLNWEVVRAVTSDDVNQFEPDCVLATHYTTPKATRYPTIGMMTNPPEYFDLFPNSLENVLTYDAYLPGSAAVTQHIRDIHFGTGKDAVIDEAHFYLSCPRTPAPIRPPGPRRLFYVGTRWDEGQRHGDLFQRLASAVPLDIYGPEARWRDLKQYHRGRVPFDGVSMIERIREAGIALCIHSPEHLRLGIPTMRIWETIAAGAIVITDAEEFGRAHFGDSLLYLDRHGRGDVVEQITAHVEWVRSHPAAADEMALRAHALLNERYCLERQFERLPALLARARRTSGYAPPRPVSGATGPAPTAPAVEYIVRAGTRPVRYAKRALDSLKAQSHPAIAVALVWVGDRDGLDALLYEFRDAFAVLKVIRVPEAGVRSHSLWAGLRQIEAPFFGILDDDDVLHPNHVASVLDRLRVPGAPRLARSGGVRVQEEAGHFEDQSHFHGPLGDFVPETRRLMHFGPVDAGRLLDGDKYVLSHSWIAARDLLTADVLDDPNLEVLEDLYLYALLAARTPCAFSWRATAEWNWRSGSRDNACLSEPCFGPCLERVRLRLMRTPGASWTPPPPPPPPPPLPPSPRPPASVPVTKSRWVAGTKGLWRVLTQPHRALGRVRRGMIALWTDGPRALARRVAALGRR